MVIKGLNPTHQEMVGFRSTSTKSWISIIGFKLQNRFDGGSCIGISYRSPPSAVLTIWAAVRGALEILTAPLTMISLPLCCVLTLRYRLVSNQRCQLRVELLRCQSRRTTRHQQLPPTSRLPQCRIRWIRHRDRLWPRAVRALAGWIWEYRLGCICKRGDFGRRTDT